MSRAWTRTTSPTDCGDCGNTVAAGDPIQAVSIPGVKRMTYRCPLCVGPAPSDLPAVEIKTSGGVQSTRKLLREDWRGVGALAVDFKLKQAGDR